jgi:hypothetical protein
MAFAQLTYRESLRDIESCLRALQSKLYHMGFRGKVSRSTLADANESHDWRIFADFAQGLLATARVLFLKRRRSTSSSGRKMALAIDEELRLRQTLATDFPRLRSLIGGH